MLSKLISVSNRILRPFNRRVSVRSIAPPIPPAEAARVQNEFERAKEYFKEFTVISDFRWDAAPHATNNMELECEFATEQIARITPGEILDIGSYRQWLIGVMSHFHVHTLDVRERASSLSNETILTEDIASYDGLKKFDLVTSLSSIEHIGLGRYGDSVDFDGDKKAIEKIANLLRQDGNFVFSVPMTRGEPCVAYNSHRIYSYEMIKSRLAGFICEHERFLKKSSPRFCEHADIVSALGEWDVYLGCYRKKS